MGPVKLFQAHLQNCEKRLLTPLFLSVLPPPRKNSSPTGRIYMKFNVWVFFRKSVDNIKFFKIWQHFYVKAYLYLLQYIAESFLESKICQIKVAEKIKTQIFCSITFSRKSCLLWNNVKKYVKSEGSQMTRRKRIACWIIKATDKHSE